jgi:dTDP-4-dehydrorhamnose reductase
MKNIILFGSTGMLGNYVKKVLSMEDYKIHSINREIFDIETADWKKLNFLLASNALIGDIVINCAGAIPQQQCEIKKYTLLNTVFPYKLGKICKNLGLKLIHITTDCVFSGITGNYNENHIHDAKTVYGISKSLGEMGDNMCIIRTSIIGEEFKNKNNLIEWLKKNNNSEIEGYTNVLWNGVTCYQLSKIILQILKGNMLWIGVRHFYSPNIVSKYDLCCYINKIYNLNIKIQKNNNYKKNMTLTSLYPIDHFNIPNIFQQIKEQYDFNILER